MLPDQYQKLAARTLIDKPGFDISDRDIMLVWNAVGLAGETGELAGILPEYTLHYTRRGKTEAKLREVLINELGDCFWYAAGICTKLNLPFERPIDFPFTLVHFGDLQNQMTQEIGGILEHIKKGVFHQHGIDEPTMARQIKDYCHVLISICRHFGMHERDVWTANIEKLKKRYPDGFKSEDSIRRVDVQPTWKG